MPTDARPFSFFSTPNYYVINAIYDILAHCLLLFLVHGAGLIGINATASAPGMLVLGAAKVKSKFKVILGFWGPAGPSMLKIKVSRMAPRNQCVIHSIQKYEHAAYILHTIQVPRPSLLAQGIKTAG